MLLTSTLRCFSKTFGHVSEVNVDILLLLGVYLVILQSGSFLATTHNFLIICSNVHL